MWCFTGLDSTLACSTSLKVQKVIGRFFSTVYDIVTGSVSVGVSGSSSELPDHDPRGDVSTAGSSQVSTDNLTVGKHCCLLLDGLQGSL
jgi:hypothetical protein